MDSIHHFIKYKVLYSVEKGACCKQVKFALLSWSLTEIILLDVAILLGVCNFHGAMTFCQCAISSKASSITQEWPCMTDLTLRGA